LPSLWRISVYADLKGLGGLKASNRWNTKGLPIVYLAQSAAGAALERLVHLLDEGDRIAPVGLSLIQVLHPDGVECLDLTESALPLDWSSNLEITRRFGDVWLQERRSCLLSVPSVAAPFTKNVLLNPEHPDAHLVTVKSSTSFDLEPRLRRLADFALSYRSEVRYVSPDE
jgi:RES domain-containing protein